MLTDVTSSWMLHRHGCYIVTDVTKNCSWLFCCLLQASHKALNGMVANIFSHQSSLKRVRFERKAIEKGIRDSNPNLTESQTLEAVNQSHYSQARSLPDRIQRSRSLVYPSYESYRDAARLRTYSTSNLNNNSSHSNSAVNTNRVSLTNYLSNFDSSLTPSLEGISTNGIPRGPTPPVRSHRPIQRTYSAPIPDVSSGAVGEASGKRAGVGVSRSHSMKSSMFSGRPFGIGMSRDQYEVSAAVFLCVCFWKKTGSSNFQLSLANYNDHCWKEEN